MTQTAPGAMQTIPPPSSSAGGAGAAAEDEGAGTVGGEIRVRKLHTSAIIAYCYY